MQKRLPEALGDYARRKAARFHMPGHKGRGMGGFFHPELMGWDITELSISDDLHNPQSYIALSQQACTKRYGAAHSFFLVNGSTAGIHALLFLLAPGSRVLIGRDCHRAVLNGLALSGLACGFVWPGYDSQQELYGCVTPAALEQALQKDAYDAVFITSPNYYGLCADIPALSAVARKYGALFFVDAAHGAHFPFSKELPSTPAGYADGWVNSAHKTLNALGQAAYLHIGAALCAADVQRALSLVQTSSPSYLLLSSLDWAFYTADLGSPWEKTVRDVRSLATQINNVPGLCTLPQSVVGAAGIADKDETRLVIDFYGRGITGYTALAKLEEQNVFVEMADMRRVVCICTPSDDPAWYVQLVDALRALPYGLPIGAQDTQGYEELEQALPLYIAARAQAASVALQQAKGCVAVGCVGLYPPGIPLWVPGERINAQCIERIVAGEKAGASTFGVHKGCVDVVREA